MEQGADIDHAQESEADDPETQTHHCPSCYVQLVTCDGASSADPFALSALRPPLIASIGPLAPNGLFRPPIV